MNIFTGFPPIVVSLLALLVGLVMLVAGGDFLVSGAVKLARRWGMSSLLIGLTVVAFGTSVPELFISLTANLQGFPDIMIGNVVGSNIANVGLVLGISVLLSPVLVRLETVAVELYLVLFCGLVTGLAAWFGIFPRILGIFFVGGLIAYTVLSYRAAGNNKKNGISVPGLSAEKSSETGSYFYILALTLGGFVVLAVGSKFFIKGAVDIAGFFGVSELFIGLTLAAVGTSLPELASCVAAIRRRESHLLLGNVIGSNLFNLMMVLGCAAIVKPFSMPPLLLYRDLPVMLVFSAVLIPLIYDRKGIYRRHGLMLLLAYLLYLALLF